MDTTAHITISNSSPRRVSGLWVSGALPHLARLCIQSYLDHGIEFQLFTYGDGEGIPAGTHVRDAREILPQAAVFRHVNGSFAFFEDWFRNEYLVREGGYWSDWDVACLSDAMPREQCWFCAREAGVVGTSVLAFPPHHPLMEALRRMSEDPAAPAPWDTVETLRAKGEWSRCECTVEGRRRNAPEAYCGTAVFTEALRHFGLLEHAQPSSRLYPLLATAWRSCYNGDCHLASPELAHAWAIHLWGEMLRFEPAAWENLVHDSIVGQLLARHLPGVVRSEEISACRPRVRILVGVGSCAADSYRRQVCRDTWMSHLCVGIDCRFFLERRHPLVDEPDVVTLWERDDCGSLWDKRLAFYAWALDHYDFEWLCLCGDDTYLALMRLDSLCLPEFDVVEGESLQGCGEAGSGSYCCLMRRACVEKVVALAREVDRSESADAIWGYLRTGLGAGRYVSPLWSSGKELVPWPDNHVVACGGCSPIQQYDIDMVLHGVPVGVMQGEHRFWRDELWFYRNGRFTRRSSGCMGTYLLCGERAIILQWDNSPEDFLSRASDGTFRSPSLILSAVERKVSLFESLIRAR